MNKKLVILSVLAGIIWLAWAVLEIMFYGKVQPRIVDDIVGAVLLASLYKNIKPFVEE